MDICVYSSVPPIPSMFKGQLYTLSNLYMLPITLSTIISLKFSPFFQLRKARHREAEQLAEGHPVQDEKLESSQTTPSEFCQQKCTFWKTHPDAWFGVDGLCCIYVGCQPFPRVAHCHVLLTKPSVCCKLIMRSGLESLHLSETPFEP